MASTPPSPEMLQALTGDPLLPENMRQALRAEAARVFHLPFDTLVTVALNAAIMSSAWFFLPTTVVNELFSLHGSLAFAFVLSSWMYSDVPATNILGPDAIRVLAAIDQPVVLRRMIMAKSTILWCIVAPFCLVIAFISGMRAHDPLVEVYSAVGIGVIPFGVLSISAWFGILYPYHPVPIRYRWSKRRDWKPMLLRWSILVLMPYGLVPLLTGLFLVPTLLVWGLTSMSGLSTQLPDNDLGRGIALACAVSIGALVIGHRYSLRLIARRRDKLVAYLSDPLLG